MLLGDGTQICYGITGVIIPESVPTVTFAKAFNNTDYVITGQYEEVYGAQIGSAYAQFTVRKYNDRFTFYSQDGRAGKYKYNYLAIGRWK